jgi:hypothetical protein
MLSTNVAGSSGSAGFTQNSGMAQNTIGGTSVPAVSNPAPVSQNPPKDYFHVETGQKKRVRLSPDQENEILNQLNLNPNQAKAVAEFSSFVLHETIETLLSKFDGVDRVSQISVKDLKKPTGGVCDVAIANGNRDHDLRFLWTVEVKLDDGSRKTMNLGSDCFTRAAGLTKAEQNLCRALNTWVCNSANRSMLKMLCKAAEEGKTALDLAKDFRSTKTYQDLQGDMQYIAPRIDYAHPKTAKPVARGRAIGRTLVALKSATLLLANDLPVPGELIGRISRAAGWVKTNCSPSLF